MGNGNPPVLHPTRCPISHNHLHLALLRLRFHISDHEPIREYP